MINSLKQSLGVQLVIMGICFLVMILLINAGTDLQSYAKSYLQQRLDHDQQMFKFSLNFMQSSGTLLNEVNKDKFSEELHSYYIKISQTYPAVVGVAVLNQPLQIFLSVPDTEQSMSLTDLEQMLKQPPQNGFRSWMNEANQTLYLETALLKASNNNPIQSSSSIFIKINIADTLDISRNLILFNSFFMGSSFLIICLILGRFLYLNIFLPLHRITAQETNANQVQVNLDAAQGKLVELNKIDVFVNQFKEMKKRLLEQQKNKIVSENIYVSTDERLKSLIANMPGAIYRCQYDSNFKILFMSKGIESISGYSAEEIIQNQECAYHSLIHPEDLAEFNSTVQYSMTSMNSFNIEYRILHKNGTERWILDRGRGVYDKNDMGKIFIDGFLIDITQRKYLAKESERFIKILNTTSDFVGIIGPNGERIFLNQGGKRLLGYPDDFDSKLINLQNVHPPKSLAKVQQYSLPAAFKDGIWEGESIMIDVNGNEIPVSQVVISQKDKYGRIDYYATISRDIRTLKASESRLHLFEKAVESANNGIILVDATKGNNPILYANEAFSMITGYEVNEVIGQSCLFLQGDDQDQEELNDLNLAIRHKQPCSVTLRNYRKNGTLFWNELSFAPIFDQNNRLTHFVGIINDITMHKIAEDSLLKAKAIAENSVKAKTDFLATMSHEIRTPLNGMLGMMQLMLHTELDEEQEDYAKTAMVSGHHLLTVLNDILDFSKIDSGKLELESHPLDFRTCIEETIDVVAPKALEKGLELLYFIDTSIPPFLLADVVRVKQILVNLINNALKFTQQGEVTLEVNSLPFHDAKKENEVILKFAVTDSGMGIPQEIIDRLFVAFSQADASTTRKFGGTGLGLAISARLVQLMDGKIWVESKEGVGSTFYFTIKTQIPSNLAQIDFMGNHDAIHGKRVLLVTHHLRTLEFISMHALLWGVDIVSTTFPWEALEMVANIHFDLAIVDWNLPDVDAIDFAINIQQTKNDFPLLLLVQPDQVHTLRGLSSNLFAGYITKPIKFSKLFEMIVLVLQGNRFTVPAEEQEKFFAQNSNLQPLRILVVEDNPINQKLARRILEKMGHQVEIAENGLFALSALEKNSYDLIFMDVQMPEMDGLEATRQIVSKYPRNVRPPIIAMTANVMSGDREICMTVGMDDYIVKPVNLVLIKKVIQKWSVQVEKKQPVLSETSLTQEHNMETTKILDLVILEPLIEDPEFFVEIFQTYTNQAEELMQLMKDSFERKEAVSLERAVHKFKGASVSLGAKTLAALCEKIEGLSRKNELDTLAPLLKELQLIYEETRLALKEMV